MISCPIKGKVSTAGVDGMVLARVQHNACYVYERYGATYCEITSGIEGVHGRKSLHPNGKALDIGFSDLPDDVSKIVVVGEIQELLGEEFDVVLEADHIHIEYQPKRWLEFHRRR